MLHQSLIIINKYFIDPTVGIMLRCEEQIGFEIVERKSNVGNIEANS